MNDDTWHLVKNTPKVSTFLGSKGKPTPISNSEAEQISERVLQGVEKPRPSVVFEVGEYIKVIDGPFASFSGLVEEVDEVLPENFKAFGEENVQLTYHDSTLNAQIADSVLIPIQVVERPLSGKRYGRWSRIFPSGKTRHLPPGRS